MEISIIKDLLLDWTFFIVTTTIFRCLDKAITKELTASIFQITEDALPILMEEAEEEDKPILTNHKSILKYVASLAI